MFHVFSVLRLTFNFIFHRMLILFWMFCLGAQIMFRKDYGHLRVAVDIGGTFTDIIVFNRSTGSLETVLKVSTTPRNPNQGVINGLKKLETENRKIEFISHATTIATNSLLGQTGLELPKTALITTKGFRDLIEIGRQKRPSLYDFFFKKPKPLIPRELRFEVTERINSEGTVIEELNYGELESLVEKIREEKVESIAVSLLHSYVNPKHEIEIRNFLKSRTDNLYVTLSSEVDPEHREYERTSTTVVNAVLRPIVEKYLKALSDGIRELFDAPLYVMQSNGGISPIDEVAKLPASIIESGPAAGIMASKHLAETLGENNVLGFDMGGTTAKAGSIINGQPIITTEYEVGGEVHLGRIVKGSGYPVRFPFIDLAEISSGGGTIIWVDEGGTIRVGPLSAGADPGPACYGKGGSDPTITDAHVLLGRIDTNYFLGGTMKISRELSEKAFEEKIKEYTGLEAVEAAIGSIKISNNMMSRLIRITTFEKGIDPRDLTFIAYGGAGALHAIPLVEELGFKKIVVPRYPGLFSAIGLLTIDFTFTFAKSVRKSLSEISKEELMETIRELENRGERKIDSLKIKVNSIVKSYHVDARYVGQGYELIIPLPMPELELGEVKKRFNEAHKRVYGYSLEDEEVEIVNLRVTVIGTIEKLRYHKQEVKKTEPQPISKRQVYFENTDNFEDTWVYRRDMLKPGARIHGPAVIEQYDTVIPVYPNWIAEIDPYENTILRRAE